MGRTSGGFRDLSVGQRSKNLAVVVYKKTAQGEFSRDFGLRDQIRRAAVSVPSNIAEGEERESNKEAARFFYIAKGSLGELITQIEIACEIGYLSSDETSDFVDECTQLSRMLGSLIKARQRALEPRTSNREPEL